MAASEPEEDSVVALLAARRAGLAQSPSVSPDSAAPSVALANLIVVVISKGQAPAGASRLRRSCA
jgi:hypothetical protein